MVDIPAPILAQVDALVNSGAYTDRDHAVADLIQRGLDSLRARRPPVPNRPPMPPGVSDPHDDRPISVEPGDVNWMRDQ